MWPPSLTKLSILAKEILCDDSVENNEEFLIAQANLLKDLEDPYNLEGRMDTF